MSLWVNNQSTTDTFELAVFAHTDAGTPREVLLYFSATTGTNMQFGNYYFIYLGTDWNDQDWHLMELDLVNYFDSLNTNGDNLDNINMIGLLADDLYFDDVTLSDSSLLNSYHLIPGASVGGYLGQYSSQPEDFGGMTDHYAWYYHSDDRGTTLATSDGSGAELHVFMPDSFGRYRYLQNGTLTDNVLLDSKAYFGHPDLYYFNARWYDYERGRWMSREPLGIDGPNLYHFTFNDPMNNTDPNGLATHWDMYPTDPDGNQGGQSGWGNTGFGVPSLWEDFHHSRNWLQRGKEPYLEPCDDPNFKCDSLFSPLTHPGTTTYRGKNGTPYEGVQVSYVNGIIHTGAHSGDYDYVSPGLPCSPSFFWHIWYDVLPDWLWGLGKATWDMGHTFPELTGPTISDNGQEIIL